MKFNSDRCIEYFQKLLAADSTTGQYEEIQKLLCSMLDEMGYAYQVLRKGGVIADLGGEGNALAVTAHLDDIGLMVRHINADGTLNVRGRRALSVLLHDGKCAHLHQRRKNLYWYRLPHTELDPCYGRGTAGGAAGFQKKCLRGSG